MKDNISNKSDIDSFDNTEDIRSNLGEKTVRSSAVTISAQIIKVVIQTVSMVVLARLFTPRDFGLIAMVSAIFGFLQIFQDLGLSTATIQKENISHDQISNLFWINILLSGCIAIFCASISPLIAWFYAEPKITLIAVAMSVSFLIAGFGTQHRAILMRQMQFGKLAFVEITAMALGILSAIVLYSFEYWALVALSLITAFTTTLGLWFVCCWRPGMPKRNAGTHAILNFGYNLTAVGILSYLSRNMDNILIGRVWGSSQLGFYSRAYNLFLIPISQIVWPIASVFTPVLSRLRGDDERFKKYFLNAVSGLALVTIPIGFFLIIMAEEVILILYGNKWQEAIPIFRYLSISMAVQPILSSVNWLFITTGRGREFLVNTVMGSFIIILSFFIGLPYGPPKVAICYSIAIICWLFPNMYFATKTTPVSIKDILRANTPAFVSSIISGFSIIIFKYFFKSILNDVILAIICLLLMTAIYLICMFFLDGQKEYFASINKIKKTLTIIKNIC